MSEGFLSFLPHLFNNPQKGIGLVFLETVNADNVTYKIGSIRQNGTPHMDPGSPSRMECWPVGLRFFICAEYSRARGYRLVTDSVKNRMQGGGRRGQGKKEGETEKGKRRMGGWKDRLKNKGKRI